MTQSLPPKAIVLYADDDFEDLELVREAFEHYSHAIELLTFANGVELMDHLVRIDTPEHYPCLIILDINMPFVNGKEVLQKIRNEERFNDIAVILFTTSTLPSEVSFANSLNAAFMTKPLRMQELHELVDIMVDHCSGDIRDYLRKQKRG